MLIYKGLIRFSSVSYELEDDSLFIGDMEHPIAEVFHDDLEGRKVSVRYWFSDYELSKDELIKYQTGIGIWGIIDADFKIPYTDTSGELWVDEELNVGGHNLLEVLRGNVGRYVYMEVDIHD